MYCPMTFMCILSIRNSAHSHIWKSEEPWSYFFAKLHSRSKNMLRQRAISTFLMYCPMTFMCILSIRNSAHSHIWKSEEPWSYSFANLHSRSKNMLRQRAISTFLIYILWHMCILSIRNSAHSHILKSEEPWSYFFAKLHSRSKNMLRQRAISHFWCIAYDICAFCQYGIPLILIYENQKSHDPIFLQSCIQEVRIC